MIRIDVDAARRAAHLIASGTPMLALELAERSDTDERIREALRRELASRGGDRLARVA